MSGSPRYPQSRATSWFPKSCRARRHNIAEFRAGGNDDAVRQNARLFRFVAIDRRQGALDQKSHWYRKNDTGDAEHHAASEEAENDQYRMHVRRTAEHDGAEELVNGKPQ